jgi:glycosyltransferase involved in cell wall biosynthesis
MRRERILWLVSWYPHTADPFDGDFIQRQAMAAARHHDIHVLFLTTGTAGTPVRTLDKPVEGLTEELIYLPPTQGPLARVRTVFAWQGVARQAIHRYMAAGRPALVHVQVPWKAGLLASWIKHRFGVPYLISEHWGLYDRLYGDPLIWKAPLIRLLLQRLYRGAAGVLAVSHYLGEGIQRLSGCRYTVVPNVVDTTLFYPEERTVLPFTFLHVSNMAPVKRVDLILEAFRQLKEKYPGQAALRMIGNRDGHFVEMAARMGLDPSEVSFLGEIPYPQVAAEMQKASCFVIYSDAETFSCVTAEAICTGLPVIASRAGALPELVGEEVGWLVPPGRPDLLAAAMESALLQRVGRGEGVGAAATCFSSEAVGSALAAVYKSYLK